MPPPLHEVISTLSHTTSARQAHNVGLTLPVEAKEEVMVMVAALAAATVAVVAYQSSQPTAH